MGQRIRPTEPNSIYSSICKSITNHLIPILSLAFLIESLEVGLVGSTLEAGKVVT